MKIMGKKGENYTETFPVYSLYKLGLLQRIKPNY